MIWFLGFSYFFLCSFSMVMDGHHGAATAALRIAEDGDPSGLLSRIHANADLISVPVPVHHESVNQNNND